MQINDSTRLKMVITSAVLFGINAAALFVSILEGFYLHAPILAFLLFAIIYSTMPFYKNLLNKLN